MTANAGHVFISHGSENRDEADAISAFLEARGIKTWIAPRDVRPGMDYSEQLQSAIEECLAFVVLVSDMANKSPYVRAETEMAFSNGKPIFPVRRSDIKPAAGLAFFLKIRHWTDAYGPSADASMDRLALELRALSGLPLEEAPLQEKAPTTPPPPPPPAPPPSEAPADEARWRAAIGPNADFYLGRWRQMDEKGSAMSWNWAACLANFYWFAYRKMWVWMAAMGFATILVSVIGLANPVAGRLSMLLLIGATFVTGAFGNHLYRQQLRPLVASDRNTQTLAGAGGISLTALIASIAATVLVMALVIALVAQRMTLQPQPAPAPAPATSGGTPADSSSSSAGAVQTGGIDASLIPGRWTDNGDCSNALEYMPDGRVIAPNGAEGSWQLNGDQLTVTGPTGSQTLRITSIDQSAAYALSPDGSVHVSQRC